MPSVTKNNCTTFYQAIGSQAKPDLLLLHGWRNDWQSWNKVIPFLSENFRLIIPDLPGFGHSDSPDQGWTTNDYLTWLEWFLQKIEVKNLSGVIGHSYGGKLAGYGWLTNNKFQLPVLKNGLFLISPSGIPNQLNQKQQLAKLASQVTPAVLKKNLPCAWRSFLYSSLDADSDYLNSTSFQEKTLANILTEDLRSFPHTKKPIQLHLAWGEEDLATPINLAYQWLDYYQPAEVFVLPNTSHHAHQEKTELITLWLQTYLELEK